MSPPKAGALFADFVEGLQRRPSRGSASNIARIVALLVDDADKHSAIGVSDVLVSAAIRYCHDARPGALGALLWRAGRARRRLGDLAGAEHQYQNALEIGRCIEERTLIVRGLLGLAILARIRGNSEETIRLFKEAHENAQQANSRELQVHTHQGMQIAANIAGDHAGEVRHAWLGYTLSVGDAEHEFEALQNVAWYACEAGIAQEALPVLKVALENVALRPSLRLHYLGTTATAAAQCGVREVIAEIRRELDGTEGYGEYPHELGLAFISLGDALEWIGEDVLARKYRSAARAIARRYGLVELLQRANSPKVRSALRLPMDEETAAEINQLRRVLATIAAGVLAAANASDRTEVVARAMR